MVQAQKKKPRRDVLDLLNQALEMAVTSSKTKFTPADIERYYMTGMKAREKREPQLAKATPKLVIPKPESRKEKVLDVDREMEEKAVIAAVDLATMLELAATEGRKLKLKDWME